LWLRFFVNSERVKEMNDTNLPDITIPAGTGKAVALCAGTRISIIASEEPQVADIWAFSRADTGEFLSTEHTRSCLTQLTPRVGDAFYSNRRRQILTILADTSPGCHDMLLSACDAERYRLLGHVGAHRNCVDNLREALAELGLTPPEIPSPVNIFENVALAPDGSLEILPPRVERGQAITLCAEIDTILVISACPMDIVPTNGADLQPKGLRLRVSVDRQA
jgi:uncharacterized protein YcgI (DUF1989 family)